MALTRRVVLDTSAYSHLRAGHVALHERLDGAAEIIVPAVVLGELHAGFRGGARLLDNEATLERFLEEPFVSVKAVDHEVALRYGEVFSQLKRSGTPIPTNDIWIAAVTLESGAHLLSFDDDFRHVSGLSWTRFRDVRTAARYRPAAGPARAAARAGKRFPRRLVSYRAQCGRGADDTGME